MERYTSAGVENHAASLTQALHDERGFVLEFNEILLSLKLVCSIRKNAGLSSICVYGLCESYYLCR
jgi:hypothetical protein